MALLPNVRSQVRRLLEASPGFRELPPERRQQVARDTARVAACMADPGGLLSRAARQRAPATGASRRAATVSIPVGPALRPGATGFDAFVDAVDFPDFVAGLIHGVFNAVVDTSIRQMEAYAELIAQVAASLDDFMADGLRDDDARRALLDEFPELFCPATASARSALAWRSGVDLRSRRQLQAVLGLPAPAADLRTLVQAARRRLARNRQQLLATTVLMGINRIVVSDGRIQARLRFRP